MNTNNTTQSEHNSIRGDTESSVFPGLTVYQAAVVRFDVHASLDDLREYADANGWSAQKFVSDVNRSMFDGRFKVWEAHPEPSDSPLLAA